MQENTAKFTNERVEQIVNNLENKRLPDDSGWTGSSVAKAAIVTINPADFVRAVTAPYHNEFMEYEFFDKDKVYATSRMKKLNVEELRKDPTVPFIEVGRTDTGEFIIDISVLISFEIL